MRSKAQHGQSLRVGNGVLERGSEASENTEIDREQGQEEAREVGKGSSI